MFPDFGIYCMWNVYISRYHEGELLPVSKGGKYQAWFKRGLAMLNVNGVNSEDGGQYTCVATNSVGSSSTIGELNVQGMYKKILYIQ